MKNNIKVDWTHQLQDELKKDIEKLNEEFNLEKLEKMIENGINKKERFSYSKLKLEISDWLEEYCDKANQNGFIIGVSGGIDSAVCSTLCAMTGYPTFVVRMPIHQEQDQSDRGLKHINWLKNKFPNVRSIDLDLTDCFDLLENKIRESNGLKSIDSSENDNSELSLANTRSRLRAVSLYAIGNVKGLLVCGTGNKVEDYGIGFFTKFGDGAVDLSPIGELMKSEVYALGRELGIIQEILDAHPTDGLWQDGRDDESQIGATYDELEWAMNWIDNNIIVEQGVGAYYVDSDEHLLNDRQREVLKIYLSRHKANEHKMKMPPICNIKSSRTV